LGSTRAWRRQVLSSVRIVDAPRDLARGRRGNHPSGRRADFLVGELGVLEEAIVEHDEQLAGRGVVDLGFDVIIAETLIHKFLAVEVFDEG
jgi:hypothetical protein